MPRFPTQPHYRWRIPMLEATRAGLAGDFVMADRLCAEALRIAKEGEIRVGKVVWALCRVSLAFLGGDPARIASDQQHLEAVALATRTRESRSFLALVYAATGRREEARATLGDAETWIDSYPFSIFCGEAIVLLGDTELASRLYPRLVSYATDHTFSWGPFGTVVFGPTPRIAADVARLLGKTEQARRLYDETLAIADRMAAPSLSSREERTGRARQRG